MTKLKLTERELLVEKLVDELKELYALEKPLPDMEERLKQLRTCKIT